MTWCTKQMNFKLGILAKATERNLKNLEENRTKEPNYESLYDENLAKLNLFSYLMRDENLVSYKKFMETLDFLEKNPIQLDHVYNKSIFEKYWYSYVSLLKVSDFNEF